MSNQSTVSEYVPISLFHIEYRKGDIVGYILAYSSLLPMFLIISFATLILFRRDIHTIFFLIGQLTNEILNYILKNTLKQPRPDFHGIVKASYGMPSNHTQFIGFFALYLSLCLLIRFQHNHTYFDVAFKFVACFLTMFGSWVISYSRIYLGYHTSSQVVIGYMCGLVFAAVWFSVIHLLISPYFNIIASSKLGELLLLRDSSKIPNVLWFEYTMSRTEARSRQRKHSTHRKSK